VIATIIPAFNEQADRVVRTVSSALEVSDLVVVVDDGSRVPIVADGCFVVRTENRGPGAAMNAGADAAIRAGATMLYRIDVGDVFRPDAKRRQQAIDAAASFSPHFDLVENKPFQPPRNWANRIYTDGAFCICSIAVTAETWRAVGGMDESLRYGDDWDFTMRVQGAIGWTMFPEITCEAGAFDGGHTKSADGDPVKRQLKHECLLCCLATAAKLKRR
jgi:glycosyltransferase involved in cell wall biosynthesis